MYEKERPSDRAHSTELQEDLLLLLTAAGGSKAIRAINYFHLVAGQARPKFRLYTFTLLMGQMLKTKQATASK